MKELGYLWEILTSLPAWIKVLLYLLVSAIVVAIAGYFGWKAAVVAAVVMLLLALFILLLAFAGRWARERREAELRGEFTGPPGLRAVSADLRERLEELDFAFSKGLARFREAGKDVYELPWFLLIGEDAVGKSTAIRNSGVELADPIPAAAKGGGSEPLDWWFTDYAVVLEAAGDLLFSPDLPVREGTTPEWNELAARLTKARKNCPLNGIILTLSVEGLTSDSPQELERKAGILARHLDALRQKMEVTVPVWLVVTRCDKLDGFEPFFEGLTGDGAYSQMLGWSNQSALEAPFRPEIVEEGLGQVIQRLRRRRLGFLLDPAPRDESVRRIDEVDQLFELPDNLESIVPSLRVYLENLFVAGEWTAVPLPLRGVYFCSGMARTDTVTDAPSTASGTSFFVRDILLDKVFREDGLITRCGPSSRQAMQRRLLIFSLGLAAIIGFLAFSVFSFRDFNRNQESQLPLWDFGASDWDTDLWHPIVLRTGVEPLAFSYQGNQFTGVPRVPTADRKVEPDNDLSLTAVHERLAYFSNRPLGVPALFRPFSWIGLNPDAARTRAQRTLFEAGVVEPLLRASRMMMSQPSPGGSADLESLENLLAREAKALTELVRVEVNIIQRKQGHPVQDPGSSFVPALLDYTCDVPNAVQLSTVMNWTFSTNPFGKGKWAPEWTSGGNSLTENIAIAQGIDRLITYAEGRISELEQNLAALDLLAKAVQNYNDTEAQLAKVASVQADLGQTEGQVANGFESLEAAKVTMEEQINVVAADGLFESGPQTLSSALDNLSSGKASHLGQVDVILKLVNSVLPEETQPDTNQPPGASPSPSPTTGIHIHLGDGPKGLRLMREIRGKLTGISTLISNKISEKVTDKLREYYAGLDNSILNAYEGQPSYLWRWKEYGRCAAGAPSYHFAEDMYLIDQRWSELESLLQSLNALQSEVDQYTGPEASRLLTITSFLINRARTTQTIKYTDAYVMQAKDALLKVARFPLVFPPGPDNEALSIYQLQGAAALLQAIAADIAVPAFTNLPKENVQPVTDFATQIAPLQNVVSALIRPDGSMAQVTVTVYNGQAQKQLSGPNLAPMPTPTPTPTPPPRSLLSKVFGGGPKPEPEGPSATFDNLNWNAISLVSASPGPIFPLSSPSDIVLGRFQVQDAFSFRVYHSLSGDDGGSELIEGGANWSALRVIARLAGQPIGAGLDWKVALKPNEPVAVWIKFSFDQPMPTTPWPTLDSLGLNKTLTLPQPPQDTGPPLDPIFGL